MSPERRVVVGNVKFRISLVGRHREHRRCCCYTDSERAQFIFPYGDSARYILPSRLILPQIVVQPGSHVVNRPIILITPPDCPLIFIGRCCSCHGDLRPSRLFIPSCLIGSIFGPLAGFPLPSGRGARPAPESLNPNQGRVCVSAQGQNSRHDATCPWPPITTPVPLHAHPSSVVDCRSQTPQRTSLSPSPHFCILPKIHIGIRFTLVRLCAQGTSADSRAAHVPMCYSTTDDFHRRLGSCTKYKGRSKI